MVGGAECLEQLTTLYKNALERWGQRRSIHVQVCRRATWSVVLRRGLGLEFTQKKNKKKFGALGVWLALFVVLFVGFVF